MSDRLAALVAGKPGDPNVPAAIDAAFGALIDGSTLSTDLAGQLYQIAKLIAGREQVQGDRHIYFAGIGGFDTHAGQIANGDSTQGLHAGLLTEVADAMAAFDNAMVEIGVLAGVILLIAVANFLVRRKEREPEEEEEPGTE